MTLFVTLSLNWMISAFLSATRYSANIVVIFVTGHALSLDGRCTVLAVTALFVVCNLLFTQLTIFSGFPIDGAGHLLAGTIGTASAFLALRSRLRRLEYLTFMLQPMGGAG